jgi:hypothetical protein
MLGDKPGTAPVIVSYGGAPRPHSQITRESVVAFLLDSLDDPALIAKAPTISPR